MTIEKSLEKIIPELTEWRRHLHMYPETAFDEYKTSEFIAEKLSSFGIQVKTGIAKTGVIGILRNGTTDKESSIGLRADMDGLDIKEENEFEYRSRNQGKMHACGHDGHMTMLLGAAKLLSEIKKLNGTIYFIFQPAEENEGGAQKMVQEGLFRQFPMKSIFGLHNIPYLPFGHFGTRSGPLMAAFDVFDIFVKGSGGHGAMPQTSKDPIIATSQLISQLQSIVSRNVHPLDSAVISITSIHGGTAYNIIPDEVHLKGTTRHFRLHIQDLLKNRINEIVKGTSTSFDLAIESNYQIRYPALVNTFIETEQAISAVKKIATADRVSSDQLPLMGSEDFSFMLNQVPGNYMLLGSGSEKPENQLHRSRYDFNDKLIPLGVEYWANLATHLLSD